MFSITVRFAQNFVQYRPILGGNACLHAVHSCGLLLQMSHVAWSVCLFLCWSYRCACWTKTAEPIKMPFGGRLLWVQSKPPRNHVLHGG